MDQLDEQKNIAEMYADRAARRRTNVPTPTTRPPLGGHRN